MKISARRKPAGGLGHHRHRAADKVAVGASPTVEAFRQPAHLREGIQAIAPPGLLPVAHELPARGTVDPGGDERVHDGVLALVDDLKVDPNPPGLDRVEHGGREVTSQGKAALKHHEMLVQEHRAGGDQPLARGDGNRRNGVPNLVAVEQFAPVLPQQDAAENVLGERLFEAAGDLVRGDDDAAVAGNSRRDRQLERRALDRLEHLLGGEQRVRVAVHEAADGKPRGEKILQVSQPRVAGDDRGGLQGEGRLVAAQARLRDGFAFDLDSQPCNPGALAEEDVLGLLLQKTRQGAAQPEGGFENDFSSICMQDLGNEAVVRLQQTAKGVVIPGSIRHVSTQRNPLKKYLHRVRGFGCHTPPHYSAQCPYIKVCLWIPTHGIFRQCGRSNHRGGCCRLGPGDNGRQRAQRRGGAGGWQASPGAQQAATAPVSQKECSR